MKSIVFFNNKGGVGKTTLACNIVGYLGKVQRKRVLLIDADPQCNATQAILSDDECDRIYLGQNNQQKTIYDVLKPLEDGSPEISQRVTPVLSSANSYAVDLLPGHPNLSMMEDRLSKGWSELLSGEISGFRVSNWAEHLLNLYRDDYDLIVFDVGPSLGALNRTIILASDYVISPFGCDIFSILGINNIASWIKRWDEDYKQSLGLADRRERTGQLRGYNVILDTSKKFRFGGYSVQQYVSRKFKAGPRPVKAYDTIMAEIPQAVAESLNFIISNDMDQTKLRLGDIPYVYSLVPLSQSSKTPIHDLTSAEGVTGAQYKQVTEYKRLMGEIVARLLSNIGLA